MTTSVTTPDTTPATALSGFDALGLAAPILKAVKAEGYETPTPIQAQSIPQLLAGRDLLGIAQTGTGKTAAFALPILQRLSQDNRKPERGTCRALILSPTRELCSQILESFRTYGRNLPLKSTVVFGGVSINKQIEVARHGVDIMVATPGRLVDLIERKALTLAKVEIFVLDEVDQMLDLGFIHAIRKITGMLPKARQNLFFSATMPKEIAGLAANLLVNPARVEITPVATTAERVKQSVLHVDPANKLKLLVELLRNPQITRALVFTRTKHGADKVVKALAKEKFESAAIHGNKSQANREKALAGFKQGKVLALVATDIAARGIDVDGVSHVFNYDLPFVPESYVHRIGRTARAGADGEAIAFCTPEDRGLLRDIERTIRQQVPVAEHELALKVEELAPNFGWNPVGGKPKRTSGGGRHMPKSAPKKPHHRGQGPNQNQVRGGGMPTTPIDQSQFANAGRKAAGDAVAPADRARAAEHKPAAPRSEHRPEHRSEHRAEQRAEQRPQPQADRKFSGGGKGGFGRPQRPSGKHGNWMKAIGGNKAKG